MVINLLKFCVCGEVIKGIKGVVKGVLFVVKVFEGGFSYVD